MGVMGLWSRWGAVLLLGTVLAGAARAEPDPGLKNTVSRLGDEWAEIFYTLPRDQQAPRLRDLLARVQAFSRRYPGEAEPLILEAIVLCLSAAAEFGFSSLSKVERARDLLVQAIDIDPRAMEGSAYITLGNLYYRVPGWPISYGDTRLARQYLEAALRLYPDGLDSNYFYGDFLLEEGEYEQALPYLEKAEQAPIRPHMRLSDQRLKEEIRGALVVAREKRAKLDGFFSRSEPSFGSLP